MELKDQILQTKERKKGFLNAMPETTRTQVDAYTKFEKIAKRFWIVIVCGAVLALLAYLVACLVNPEYRWLANLGPAVLLLIASVVAAFSIRSLAKKSTKAISLGAPDYVEELNLINARLAGLERAEKARVEAEKQEAKAKARAEAAQRDAELALQKQQEAVQNVTQTVQNAVQQPTPAVEEPVVVVPPEQPQE